MARNLQWVWPKEGPRGRAPRSAASGLKDILTGKGPDMFLQHKGSKGAISVERWTNWDAYHSQGRHFMEQDNVIRHGKTRGFQRYDPATRTYKEWATPEDWGTVGTDDLGVFPNGNGFTHFTEEERIRMNRQGRRGQQVDPLRMGKDWNMMGPNRFRAEHDEFWREAHQIGENRRQGLPLWWGPNPNMTMHAHWPNDWALWYAREN